MRMASVVLFAVCMMQMASAAVISYDAVNIGGDRWQYDYTIYNDTTDNIDMFQIYFGFGQTYDPSALYDNLAVDYATLPAGWDADALNPVAVKDPLNPGIYQLIDPWTFLAYTFTNPLAPGDGLGIFAVAFDWFGGDVSDTPYGGQFFEVFDLNDVLDSNFERWDVVNSGTTPGGRPTPPVSPEVPEPGTLALFGTGIAGLAVYCRRNRKR